MHQRQARTGVANPMMAALPDSTNSSREDLLVHSGMTALLPTHFHTPVPVSEHQIYAAAAEASKVRQKQSSPPPATAPSMMAALHPLLSVSAQQEASPVFGPSVPSSACGLLHLQAPPPVMLMVQQPRNSPSSPHATISISPPGCQQAAAFMLPPQQQLPPPALQRVSPRGGAQGISPMSVTVGSTPVPRSLHDTSFGRHLATSGDSDTNSQQGRIRCTPTYSTAPASTIHMHHGASSVNSSTVVQNRSQPKLRSHRRSAADVRATTMLSSNHPNHPTNVSNMSDGLGDEWGMTSSCGRCSDLSVASPRWGHGSPAVSLGGGGGGVHHAAAKPGSSNTGSIFYGAGFGTVTGPTRHVRRSSEPANAGSGCEDGGAGGCGGYSSSSSFVVTGSSSIAPTVTSIGGIGPVAGHLWTQSAAGTPSAPLRVFPTVNVGSHNGSFRLDPTAPLSGRSACLSSPPSASTPAGSCPPTVSPSPAQFGFNGGIPFPFPAFSAATASGSMSAPAGESGLSVPFLGIVQGTAQMMAPPVMFSSQHPSAAYHTHFTPSAVTGGGIGHPTAAHAHLCNGSPATTTTGSSSGRPTPPLPYSPWPSATSTPAAPSLSIGAGGVSRQGNVAAPVAVSTAPAAVRMSPTESVDGSWQSPESVLYHTPTSATSYGVFTQPAAVMRQQHTGMTTGANGIASVKVSAGSNNPPAQAVDEHRMSQRMKQIRFGKVTDGYRNYRTFVPTFAREIHNEHHPITPRAEETCSKRRWDLLAAGWRRKLHEWDHVMSAEAARQLSLHPDPSLPRPECAARRCDVGLEAIVDEVTYMEALERELKENQKEIQLSTHAASSHPSGGPVKDVERSGSAGSASDAEGSDDAYRSASISKGRHRRGKAGWAEAPPAQAVEVSQTVHDGSCRMAPATGNHSDAASTSGRSPVNSHMSVIALPSLVKADSDLNASVPAHPVTQGVDGASAGDGDEDIHRLPGANELDEESQPRDIAMDLSWRFPDPPKQSLAERRCAANGATICSPQRVTSPSTTADWGPLMNATTTTTTSSPTIRRGSKTRHSAGVAISSPIGNHRVRNGSKIAACMSPSPLGNLVVDVPMQELMDPTGPDMLRFVVIYIDGSASAASVSSPMKQQMAALAPPSPQALRCPSHSSATASPMPFRCPVDSQSPAPSLPSADDVSGSGKQQRMSPSSMDVAMKFVLGLNVANGVTGGVATPLHGVAPSQSQPNPSAGSGTVSTLGSAAIASMNCHSPSTPCAEKFRETFAVDGRMLHDELFKVIQQTFNVNKLTYTVPPILPSSGTKVGSSSDFVERHLAGIEDVRHWLDAAKAAKQTPTLLYRGSAPSTHVSSSIIPTASQHPTIRLYGSQDALDSTTDGAMPLRRKDSDLVQLGRSPPLTLNGALQSKPSRTSPQTPVGYTAPARPTLFRAREGSMIGPNGSIAGLQGSFFSSSPHATSTPGSRSKYGGLMMLPAGLTRSTEGSPCTTAPPSSTAAFGGSFAIEVGTLGKTRSFQQRPPPYRGGLGNSGGGGLADGTVMGEGEVSGGQEPSSSRSWSTEQQPNNNVNKVSISPHTPHDLPSAVSEDSDSSSMPCCLDTTVQLVSLSE